MKVALVYDRVNKWGGAERVLLSLHKLFPEAPLFTSVYNAPTAGWADSFTVQTSYLQHLPFAKGAHEYYALCMPTAFESFSFDAYDLVISVTSEAAKGIITKPGTKHICYCLTPTRYLWSGYTDYFSSLAFRLAATPAVSYLRSWDLIAANRPDVMVSISNVVKNRVLTYYGRNTEVIYPPVALKSETSRRERVPRSDGIAPGYFLVVSRLVPYKRVDLAVRACTKLQVPLVVIGTGSEEQKLKRQAGPTITFLGSLTDAEVSAYYENCQALLFPGEEDFGITVVEAQSFGKPVIAYKKGGALETIRDGKTGVFFSSQTVSELEKAIQEFSQRSFNPSDCTRQAERFSEKRFLHEFTKTVEASFENGRIR